MMAQVFRCWKFEKNTFTINAVILFYSRIVLENWVLLIIILANSYTNATQGSNGLK